MLVNPSESIVLTFLTVTKHLTGSNKGREIYFGSRNSFLGGERKHEGGNMRWSAMGVLRREAEKGECWYPLGIQIGIPVPRMVLF